MKITIQYLVTIICLFGISAFVQAQEYRSSIEFSKDLSPKWKGKVDLELRSNNDGTEIERYSLLTASFDYQLNNRLEWSGSVRYAGGISYERETTEEYFHQYRFSTDITYDFKRFDNAIKISNRFRYQYAIDEDEGKQFFRYKLEAEYELTKDIEPYIAVEPYYAIDQQKFSKLRIYTGSKFEILKKDIEVYIISEAHLKYEMFTTNYSLGFAYEF